MKNIIYYNSHRINIINNEKDNNKISKTIQKDIPSLSILRSTDFTKRDYKFQINPKSNINKNRLNNNIGYNYISNTIKANQSIDESLGKRKLISRNSNAFKLLKSFN